MKPRIKKINGLWHCYDFRHRSYIGVGFFFQDAFEDWIANVDIDI